MMIVGLLVLSAVGMVFMAWLLRLPVICLALAVAAPLVPTPAGAQVGQVNACTNNQCNQKRAVAAFPTTNAKWDCTTQTNCGTGGGGSCTSCISAQSAITCGTANEANALRGNISGTQVTSCPAACTTTPTPTPINAAAPFLVTGGSGGEQSIAIGFEQNAGDKNVSSYLARTGQLVVGVQGRPMERGAPVTLNTRMQPGGWPYCNGDSYIVTQAGTLGQAWPLGMPWVRKPGFKVRAGQLVYPGYAGTEAIGHLYRAVADCETGEDVTVPWPTSAGVSVLDGTCTLREEAGHPITFTDGTARFAMTWGADAYCGYATVTVGTDRGNEPVLRSAGGDNTPYKIATDYPNVGGPPFYASGGLLHSAFGQAGDTRSGQSENVLNATWDPWVFELAGNPSWMGASYSGAAGLGEPQYRPTVVAVAGGALSAVERCFTLSWEDERWQSITKTSRFFRCVTPVAGQCLEVSIPATRWPSSPDNASGQAAVRAWVYSGSEAMPFYVGSIEKPKGVAGSGNDRLLLCNDAEFRELQTGEAYNRAARSIVLMGDPSLRPQTFTPGLSVAAGYTMVCPSIEDGHCYIAEGVQCSPDCGTCKRGYTLRGTTGTQEPVWMPATAPFNLVFENGNCWKRLGLIGHAMALSGPLRFVNPGPRGSMPKVGGQIWLDATGALDMIVTNPACVNPLDFAACPPLKRFNRNGVQ